MILVPDAFAGGVGGAAPEADAGVGTALGDPLDHGLAAERAGRGGWFGWGCDGYGGATWDSWRGLDGLNEGEELGTIYEG